MEECQRLSEELDVLILQWYKDRDPALDEQIYTLKQELFRVFAEKRA